MSGKTAGGRTRTPVLQDGAGEESPSPGRGSPVNRALVPAGKRKKEEEA
jgi:hypothetical protein